MVRFTRHPERHFARLEGELHGVSIPAAVRRDGSAITNAAWLAAAGLPPHLAGRSTDPLQTTVSLTRSCDRVLHLELLDVGHRHLGRLPDLRASYDGSWEGTAFAAEVIDEGARRRIRLVGELDIAATTDLAERLTSVAAPVIEVDLSDLRFVDGTGLTALLTAKRKAEAAGRRFRMTGAHGIVRRVFDVTGLSGELDD